MKIEGIMKVIVILKGDYEGENEGDNIIQFLMTVIIYV